MLEDALIYSVADAKPGTCGSLALELAHVINVVVRNVTRAPRSFPLRACLTSPDAIV